MVDLSEGENGVWERERGESPLSLPLSSFSGGYTGGSGGGSAPQSVFGPPSESCRSGKEVRGVRGGA